MHIRTPMDAPDLEDADAAALAEAEIHADMEEDYAILRAGYDWPERQNDQETTDGGSPGGH